MHIYIYDAFVNQKKYNKTLARIETRITDLGLNGKISRLGLIKNVPNLVENELKRGAKTIIAVGNDQTINQIINTLINLDSKVPLGIIPVGANNNLIANSLGIEHEENACDTLSARRIITLDAGRANDQYFLVNASINSAGTTIEIDQNYSIEIMGQGVIDVININANINEETKNIKHNPQDGILELCVKAKKSKNFLKKISDQSIFPFNKLTILNKKTPVILDGVIKIPAPVEINAVKQIINVIVGKKRTF